MGRFRQTKTGTGHENCHEDRFVPGATPHMGEPRIHLREVAYKVGYSGPFALSSAFKRVRGVSPQEYRSGARSSV